MYKIQETKMIRIVATGIVLVSATLLSGCAAIQTEVQHHDLAVNSKMSSSVFLPPVTSKDKSIYVSVKNTSSEQNLGIKKQLVADLKANGWTISKSFTDANDVLQINVLQAGKVKDSQAAMGSLANGFGGTVVGGTVGDLTTGTLKGAAIGGAVGGAASWLAGMAVKDVTYSMTTDIQISVKAPKGTSVRNTTNAAIKQGSSTVTEQTYSSKSDRMIYKTRIVTYADQANLKFSEAKPAISAQMASEIANIF